MYNNNMTTYKHLDEGVNYIVDTTVLIQMAIRMRPQTLTYLRQEARLQHSSYARYIGSILDAYVQNCIDAEKDATHAQDAREQDAQDPPATA